MTVTMSSKHPAKAGHLETDEESAVKRKNAMCQRFFILCGMFLTALGCAGVEPLPRTGETIRAVIKLTHNERPRLGTPIELTLGIVNEGVVPVTYDFAHADNNDSLVVTGPDGRRVPYILGHIGALGPDLQLAPGEEAHFTLDLDLAEQYLIDKPGHYIVRYEGKGLVIDDKPAKVIPCKLEIDVADGKLDRRMEIAARLFPVVPKSLTFHLSSREFEVDVLVDIRAEVPTPEQIVTLISFRVFDGRVESDHELLGKTRWGFLSARVGRRTEEFWPNWRRVVTDALRVTSP